MEMDMIHSDIKWTIGPIDSHVDAIKILFEENIGHRHEYNYIHNPLFDHTKFSYMGWIDTKLVYYTAGIEIPEFNGSIRIMSRHTRSRKVDWGTTSDDLDRGLKALDTSVHHAIGLGYKEVWVCREENPKILQYLSRQSNYNWDIQYEKLYYGGYQYVMRLIESL